VLLLHAAFIQKSGLYGIIRSAIKFFLVFHRYPSILGVNFSSVGIAGEFASRHIFIDYTLFLVETMNGLL
jgi:hypothetical protein